MITAIGYCRKSTDRQEQSIAQQKEAIERYARKNGYEVVNWYCDEGISGSRFKDRPAFQKMISACSSDNSFQAVLVFDKSRFGRPQNTKELISYEYRIEETGKELVYVNANYKNDGTIASALMGVIETHQAGQYLEDLSGLISRACVHNAGTLLTGRRAPYGYNHLVCDSEGKSKYVVKLFPEKRIKIRYDMSGKEVDKLAVKSKIPKVAGDYIILTPDPEKAKVVKDIFKWYSQGYGGRQIADKLNVLKVPSPMKPTKFQKKGDIFWSCSTIRDILRNFAYIGDTVYNRTSKSKYHSIEGDGDIIKKNKPDKFTDNPKSKWIVAKDTHKALIQRALFDKCEKLRQERAKSYNVSPFVFRGVRPKFLFSGLRIMSCGDSDYAFVGNNTMKNGKAIPAYECGLYRRKGKHACARKTIERDKFEDFILGRVKDRIKSLLSPISQRKMLKNMLKDYFKNGNGHSIDEIKERISALNMQIDNLIEFETAKPNFKDRIMPKLESLNAEREQKEAKLRELETKKTIKINVERVFDRAVERYKDFTKPLSRLDLPQKQEVIRQMVKQIKVYATGEGLITYYNIPNTEATSPLFSATVEREMGIEPTQPAWKASVLPLNYSRILLLTKLRFCSQELS